MQSQAASPSYENNDNLDVVFLPAHPKRKEKEILETRFMYSSWTFFSSTQSPRTCMSRRPMNQH
jgi:hypothetical protein